MEPADSPATGPTVPKLTTCAGMLARTKRQRPRSRVRPDLRGFARGDDPLDLSRDATGDLFGRPGKEHQTGENTNESTMSSPAA